MPYSGPASAYGLIGRAQTAYFKQLNESGGINGRTINLISLDDGYSPPKTVEQTRRLVEQEEVAFLFNQLGVAPCLAVRDYLNQNGVPQLFVASGAAVFSDPAHYKWTLGLQPNYQTEARIFAKHILASRPGAKIAVLYQNDSFGKDYLIGLKAGLGPDNAAMIVKEASYETLEPTIDSQVASCQGAGADVFLIAATPKFAAQAIRRSFDLGWDATRYVSNVSISISAVLKAAGLEKAKGLVSANYAKDASDPRWSDDAGFKAYKAFIDADMSEKDFVDSSAIYGYNSAVCLAHVLRQCGDDLSRDNILAQATGIKDLELPMLLPSVRDQHVADGLQRDPADADADVRRRASWRLFGDVLEG